MNSAILRTLAYEVISMADIKKFSSEMRQYFDKLPKLVQESIMQSGMEIASMEDLKNCENMIQNAGGDCSCQ